MRVKDYNILFNTLGKQLNFILFMGIWALLLFVTTIKLPIEELAKWILGGITLFLSIYFLGYALILTKKIVEKYYK
jgi:CHASE2 domain-containing sensor protein